MRQIIYAWNYLELGGAQIHLLAIIKEARKEFKTVVVLPEGSNKQFISFLDEENVEYRFFKGYITGDPAHGLFDKFTKHKEKAKSERAMLKFIDENFDLRESIVHIDLAPQQSLAALVWLSLKTRVFVTAHNALPQPQKWRDPLWRIKFQIISRFKNFECFCSNEHARDYFRKYYSKEKGDRIKVTYTSINPAEIDAALAADFDREKLLEKYNLPNDKFIVLVVGQFVDRKGRWTFLEAAKKVAEANKDIVFVWVSNSKPPDDEIKRAESYGLGDKFRLIMSHEVGKERIDLFKMFRLADVYALPSFVEGLPIALLEAMALGIPSISTNVFAIPEAVKNLETGILIEAGDSDALADAILKLKSDENLREKLSKQGREYVLKHFDEREVARIAIASYKEAFSAGK